MKKYSDPKVSAFTRDLVLENRTIDFAKDDGKECFAFCTQIIVCRACRLFSLPINFEVFGFDLISRFLILFEIIDDISRKKKLIHMNK